jgi:hypothetical protein
MKTYTIKITGEKFSFEQNISEIQKAKIIAFLNLPSDIPLEDKDSNSYESEQTKAIPISRTPNGSTSPAEYILEKNASTNVEKIAVFLMYFEDVLLRVSVRKEEIKGLFESTKQIMPKNFTRDFDKAVGIGWVSQANEQGKYYLTNTGRKAVLNNFMNVGTTSSTISIKRKVHKKKLISQVRDEVENLDVKNDGNYWKLSKGNRVIWLTFQAELKGIKNLNLKEISRLADKQHDNIPAKNIFSLTVRQEKDGLISLSPENNITVVKLLQKGIDFIKNYNAG